MFKIFFYPTFMDFIKFYITYTFLYILLFIALKRSGNSVYSLFLEYHTYPNYPQISFIQQIYN